MVKILGGEIVRDNDPRVLALQAAHEAASRQHAEQQAANDYYRYYGTNNPYNTNNIHPNHYMQYPPHYPNYHQPYYYPHPQNLSSYPYSPSPYSQPHVPSTTANSYFNHNSSPSSSTSSSSSSLPHTDLSASSSASPSSSSSSSSSSPSASSHPSSIHPSLYPSQRIRQSNPYAYNLFGLPDVKVLDINVKPHLYLLAFLCVFLIGPRALVAVVFAFFTYRWHLNNVAKEEARKRPYPAHFKKPFAYSSPQQHFRRSGIATLHDLHQSDQRSLGQM